MPNVSAGMLFYNCNACSVCHHVDALEQILNGFNGALMYARQDALNSLDAHNKPGLFALRIPIFTEWNGNLRTKAIEVNKRVQGQAYFTLLTSGLVSFTQDRLGKHGFHFGKEAFQFILQKEVPN